MKISIEWLKDCVGTDLTAEEIGEKLTYIGHMQDGPIQDVGEDQVLDLEVRQNRPDVLSIVGIARELAATIKKDLIMPQIVDELGGKREDVKLTIADEDLCYRFHALTINGIVIKDSPDWIKKRLEAAGIKTINNIVDITNYVGLELGIPLHAYDADKVEDRHITIRRAKKGETLIVFGGKKVSLTEDDLIHVDKSGPIGFAGIMGGEEKSVHQSTTSIILEGAVYNQASVRRSSLRHSIRNESSTRHEKFLNPEMVDVALKRAVKLILEMAGGELAGNTDAYPHPQSAQEIEFRFSEIKRLGGVDIESSEVIDILTRLGIEIKENKSETLTVIAPIFRTDLEGSADLVEEVLRIYGYDEIPVQKITESTPYDIQSPLFDFEEKIKDYLVAAGFDEQITEPLTVEAEPTRVPIHLENSLTTEKSMLRTTLRFPLQQSVIQHIKYRKDDIRVFEVGKVYFVEEDHYNEQTTVGIMMHDNKASYSKIKGIIEFLAARLERKLDDSFYIIERISQFDIPTWYAEVNVDAIFESPRTQTTNVLTTPPQIIRHDFSFVVDRETKVGEIINSIKDSNPLVYTAEIGEEPREVEGNKKSVFIHVSYHDPKKTLSEEDVIPIRNKILQTLESKYGVVIR